MFNVRSAAVSIAVATSVVLGGAVPALADDKPKPARPVKQPVGMLDGKNWVLPGYQPGTGSKPVVARSVSCFADPLPAGRTTRIDVVGRAKAKGAPAWGGQQHFAKGDAKSFAALDKTFRDQSFRNKCIKADAKQYGAKKTQFQQFLEQSVYKDRADPRIVPFAYAYPDAKRNPSGGPLEQDVMVFLGFTKGKKGFSVIQIVLPMTLQEYTLPKHSALRIEMVRILQKAAQLTG